MSESAQQGGLEVVLFMHLHIKKTEKPQQILQFEPVKSTEIFECPKFTKVFPLPNSSKLAHLQVNQN